MNNIERKRCLYLIIEHYGKELQLEVVQEELSELIQAISKYKRAKSHKNHDNIIEEVADVFIMLNQLVTMLCIPWYEVEEQIDYKLNRQLQRIKEDK